MNLLIVINVPLQHRMFLIGETGCRVYGNSINTFSFFFCISAISKKLSPVKKGIATEMIIKTLGKQKFL